MIVKIMDDLFIENIIIFDSLTQTYSDILVEVPNNRTGIVIELKYAENGDMDAACDEALKQIEEKSYVDKLKQDGMRNFIKYGIACFKKDCKVVVSK